jgi:4-diphosphocytidyl-2-C-methyl-D-erythritol kinase
LAATSSYALKTRAFAKVNLGLKIVGKRPDGFHEIRTVYQTVGLYDLLEISIHRRSGGIDIECSDPAIPVGRGNLVFRACEQWRQLREFKGGISIRLTKTIPVGSGLGGASSDAAATVLGLERLTGHRLKLPELYGLAIRLGSDVPFFLMGGRGLGIGRGEEVYPLADLPRRHCLIAFPGVSVSTAVAYAEAGRLLAAELTKSAKTSNIYSFGAWSHFPQEGWGPAENDFERVVFARWPQLAKFKRQLFRAGAEMASLTGSGSAVFGLFDSARDRKRAAVLIPQDWQVFHTRTVSRSEYWRLLLMSSDE